MLCEQVSLGKRLSEIRGKMGKKVRLTSFRSREAERLSLVSLHKPAFPAHRAMQPGWCLGKDQQPLCCSAHSASSTGSPGSHSLPSAASLLRRKRKGKEIKHKALQQMAAKGTSPSPCSLVLPRRFKHSSASTGNRTNQRDLGAQTESSVPAIATASLSTAQQLLRPCYN